MGPELLVALNDPAVRPLKRHAQRGRQALARTPGRADEAYRHAARRARRKPSSKPSRASHGKAVTRSKPILEGELPLDGQPPRRPAPAGSARTWPSPSARRLLPSARLDQCLSNADHDTVPARREVSDCSGARALNNTLAIWRHRLGQDHAGERDHQRDGDSRPDRAGFHHQNEDTGEIQCAAPRTTSSTTPAATEHDGAVLKTHTPHAPRTRSWPARCAGPGSPDLLDGLGTPARVRARLRTCTQQRQSWLGPASLLISMHPDSPEAPLNRFIGEAVHMAVQVSLASKARGASRKFEISGSPTASTSPKPLD